MLNKYIKAQSSFVYVFMFAVIVMAMILMFKQIKRSVQGKYKESADVFSSGAQYDPNITEDTIADAR